MTKFDYKGKPPFHNADEQYVSEHGNKSEHQFSHPTGTGFRPAFHALWHLEALGVVKDLATFEGEAWRGASDFMAQNRPMRVAVIDTAVDYRHENLTDAVDKGLMRDFSQSELGAFAVLDPDALSIEDKKDRAAIAGKAKAAAPGPLADALTAEIKWINKHKGNASLLRSRQLRVFGAHGTAVAGLIGARPRMIKLRFPSFVSIEQGQESLGDSVCVSQSLPYAGINPFCRIVPICVTVTPTPTMLLGAIEYARLVEPDVVVIADSWDRPDLNSCGNDEGKAWTDLETAFLKLCKESIVLCAAGNKDRDALVYPASLSKETEGPWAVGACNSNGADLSYSPDHTTAIGKGHWMIKTLSTELPRFDSDEKKIDPWEAIDPDLGSYPASETYPARDIISTDLPGRAGYNPSSYDHSPHAGDEHFEIASLFCRFAGTSAATAIAGGLVSLIPRDMLKKAGRPAKSPADPQSNLAPLFDFIATKKLFKN